LRRDRHFREKYGAVERCANAQRYVKIGGAGLGDVAILVGVVVVAGGIALTIYGSTVTPQQHEMEQVLSNDRFPK